MKSRILALAISGVFLTLAGCGGDEPVENPALAAPVPDGMVRGTVLETMDASGYTYVHIDLGDEQRWYAGAQTSVSVGDVVQTNNGMSMGPFTSSSLNRSFDNMYFVEIIANLSQPTLPDGHPTTPAQQAADAAAIGDVAVDAAEDGQNIASIYAASDSLAGQTVSVRGKVVKYNEGILGWNFIHIQDGSGTAADGNNDLTVTSKANTAVGETVVLTGTVVLDKDFGAGYAFPVLIEDASIVAE